MTQDGLGGAAKQKTFKSAVAAGTDHQQIECSNLRRPCKLRGGFFKDDGGSGGPSRHHLVFLHFRSRN